MNKRAKEYFKLAESYGFVLVRLNKHAVFKHKDGPIVVCPVTPSDSKRGLKQFQLGIYKALRRHNNSTAAG